MFSEANIIRNLKILKHRYPSFDHKAYDYYDFSTIEDGILRFKNGTYSLIFKIQPSNFELMTIEHMEHVVAGYNSMLLNVLAGEVLEFVIQTRNVKIDKYLTNIQKIKHIDTKLYKDYSTFLGKLAKDKNIITKDYIGILSADNINTEVVSSTIITTSSQLKKATFESIKTSLEQRFSVIRDHFENIGLRIEKLDTGDIIDLMNSSLNLNSSASNRHRSTNLKDLSQDLYEDIDYVKVGDTFYTNYYLHGLPKRGSLGFLEDVIRLPYSSNMSIKVSHLPVSNVVNNLRQNIFTLEAKLASQRKNEEVSYVDDQLKLENLRMVERKYAAKESKPVNFSLQYSLIGDDLDTLASDCLEVENTFASLDMHLMSTRFNQINGFNSTFLGGNDVLKKYRNLDTDAVSSMYPFTLPTQYDQSGILYGVNEKNNTLVIHDIKNTAENKNANVAVIAKSGAGKSYFIQSLIAREAMLGHKIFIFDLEDEYKTICESYGGVYVEFDASSKNFINPFEFTSSNTKDIHAKAYSVSLILEKLYKEPLSESTRIKLSNLLIEHYLTHRTPLFKDLVSCLLKSKDIDLCRIGEVLKANYLNPHNPFGNYLNKTTNLDISKTNIIVFNLREENLGVYWDVSAMIVMEWIWEQMHQEDQFTQVIFDEAHKLLDISNRKKENAYLLYYLEAYCRGIRKRNGGIKIITQNLTDLYDRNNKSASAILENTSLKIFLGLQTNLELLKKDFNLSEKSLNYLRNARRGDCLMLTDSKQITFRSIMNY
ncbi:ATP-binding protein [candidate division WWE3 bacterium]|uniref:ATP-binding protein n=1 Tax=candidate division WWE3 bacterium TaxID=2053526 RepID=A0A955J1T6_UNCKA|nr:ATP-binding protein [candidate division WWE3 bacterium]